MSGADALTDAALAAQAQELVRDIGNAWSPTAAEKTAEAALRAVRDAARAERAEEVRQLREALALLLFPIREIVHDEPPERMIPTQHSVSDIRQGRAVLAATEPSHG